MCHCVCGSGIHTFTCTLAIVLMWKPEDKIMLIVSRAHVLPAGRVALLPGGTVYKHEGDTEDRQMAGQKNSQKGL